MAVEGGEGTASPLRIRLFGSFEVQREGEPLPPLRTRKGGWLLALLTLHHGRELERDWLAGTLWPDSPQSPAFYNLRRCLSDLRRALGAQGSRLHADGLHGLCLDLTSAEVDVILFDTAVAERNEAALERAIALYRGPLLEGCLEAWAIQERELRQEAYLGALERLAAAARARGDHSEAARFLRRAVAADALREEAQRALMETLAAGGDTAAAIVAYREFRLLLHREVNAEPSPETRALFERLRSTVRRGAARGGPRSESPRLPVTDAAPLSHREPGTGHRGHLPQPLSAFVGRERALLKIHASLASARLVTLTGIGGIGKTRLAIRAAEEGAGAYADGAWFVDLAPLAAPASGEYPALVPQAVARVLRVREEPGCPLTETLQEWLAARQLLLVLDNCEHLIDACARLAHSLLTGCPHLRILATSRQALGLTGEIAWPVPPLSLPPSEGVGGWAGTHEVGGGVGTGKGTPVVADPNPQHPTPNPLLEYEAIHLFVQRAAAARPGFALDERSAAATMQVCRRLDGIPLAIELAAVRLKALSLEQLAAHLDDRFRLLTGGSRAALPRQQTLRATLDWSYDLLSEPERVLMRRLSVFAGGWTLEAAETVCSDFGFWILDFGLGLAKASDAPEPLTGLGPTKPSDRPEPLTLPAIQNPKSKIQNEELLDLLTSLVEKSLVVYEEQAAMARYRLLETVREYFSERLVESGEADATRGRHLEYLLALAEAAEPQLTGARQGECLQRLESEHDNLRAALLFARSARGGRRPDRPEEERQRGQSADGAAAAPRSLSACRPPPAEMGLRLAGALWRFWNVRGYMTEGREQLAQALAGAPAATAGRAKALETAGSLAYGEVDYRSARSLQEESLAIRRELGDRSGIAASLRNLGLVAYQEKDYGAARSFHEESLAVYRELGNQWGIAASLHDLGQVAYQQGDPGTARSLREESLAIRRELGDRLSIATSLYDLGSVAHREGDRRAARSLYEESLAIRRELEHRSGIASSLHNLGQVAYEQGEYGAARSLQEESLTIRRELGDRWGIAASLYKLGQVAYEQGEYGAARSFYEESLAIRRGLGSQGGIADSLYNLGLLAYQQGDYLSARSLYEESLAIRRGLGHHLGIADSLFQLGLIADQEGDQRTARSFHKESLTIRRELQEDLGIAASLEALAALACGRQGQPGGGEAAGPEGGSQETEATGAAAAAARLYGAAAALRQAIGAPVPPGEEEAYHRQVSRAREMLGEPAFAAAWAEGRALSLEQAITDALRRPPRPT